ncbi:MAG: hypothetical protein IJV68_06460 [Clostridia bacterium]|nr:hypothetical protein [Clostridia bacterium]
MNEKILITDTELEKIMLSSARALPDNPSERGFRPSQIKRALSEPVRMLISLLNNKFQFLYTDGSITVTEMSHSAIDALFN